MALFMEHLQAGSQGHEIKDTFLSLRLFYHRRSTQTTCTFTPQDTAAQPRVLLPFLTGLLSFKHLFLSITMKTNKQNENPTVP